MLALAWGTSTHAGRVRSRNEDAVLAQPPLFVVADGMGGYEAGDVASKVAIDVLAGLADLRPLRRSDVLSAVRAANGHLVHLGASTGRPLGTTVCGLVVLSASCGRQRLVLLNVGDSRCYRLRDGDLEQLTHDHSVAQELLDAGMIDAEAAARHPDRHVLTRSLGAPEYLEIDWTVLDPEAGDRYLVASDGLTIELGDDAIGDLLAGDDDPEAVATDLVEAALDHGGRDNVSAVVVDVTAIEAATADPDGDPLDDDTHPRVACFSGHREADVPLGGDTVPFTGWLSRLRSADDSALYADTEPVSDT